MNYKSVISIWLLIGLFMVYFQIIIGGITRLTGSGLSITKWEIITGTLPPMNQASWLEEFDKYKSTPQYSKINEGMELGNSVFDGGTFKFIYFWEYLHRLWARSMGLIFLVPFIFFMALKKLPRSLLRHLFLVVGLAGLAATFGWIMVASGLVNRPWVNAYKLAIHLSLGISVFLSLLWTYLHYRFGSYGVGSKIGSGIKGIFLLIVLQIIFGGIMSGMKAALIFPTWPDIGGEYLPGILYQADQWSLHNFINYDEGPFVFALVQFVHRSLAYLIVISVCYYIISNRQYFSPSFKSVSSSTFILFLTLILIQIILGILTLVKSIGMVPVGLGVLHQGVAVLVIGSLLVHMFVLKYHPHRVNV